LLNKPLAEEFTYLDMEAEHIINVTGEEAELIKQCFRDIIKEYERFSPEKDYLLRNFIHILLLRIRELYRPHAKKINESNTRSMKIANQFKRLVEKNFISMREVAQYAEQLCVSPGYLSEVVKTNTGKSPREIISGILLLEAKVLLGSTGLTVTEIAHRLNFGDQAHFSHFIKQHCGCSPLQLRKKL
jgi:AraC-like DNA-binding protein